MVVLWVWARGTMELFATQPSISVLVMINQANQEKLINAKRVFDQIVHETAAVHFLADHLVFLDEKINNNKKMAVIGLGYFIYK